jgi:hypothetical protein
MDNKKQFIVNQRLRFFLKSKKIYKNADFAAKIEETPQRTHRSWSDKATVPTDILKKAKEQYPDLNLNWLFTGVEDVEIKMIDYSTNVKNTDSDRVEEMSTSDCTKKQPTADLARKLEEQDNMIAYLKQELEVLKKRVGELEED